MNLLPLNPRFVRKLLLLSCHLVRNVAYYRIGYINENGSGELKQATQFGATVNGNMLDIAVLEWCKLFADRDGRHHWKRFVRNDAEQKEFLKKLYRTTGLNEREWKRYHQAMRDYRDKFVAHLDEQNVMHIPLLGTALDSVFFLYEHVLANAPAGTFDTQHCTHLPRNLHAYYAECEREARAAYT